MEPIRITRSIYIATRRVAKPWVLEVSYLETPQMLESTHGFLQDRRGGRAPRRQRGQRPSAGRQRPADDGQDRRRPTRRRRPAAGALYGSGAGGPERGTHRRPTRTH